MKLSDYRKIANDYTSKASEITRQLSLAGIAIIWLFKNSEKDGNLFDPFLVIPLLFLSLALLTDLIQYVVGGWTWISFFRDEEKKLTEENVDPDVKAPKNKSTPIYALYYSKIILMLFSYFFLIIFLLGKL